MKILLTGASGQVGWELRRTLLPLGDVIVLDRTQADLSDVESLRAAMRVIKPDVVVNPAAYTAVDKAESESDMAFRVNAVAPGVLAEEVKNLRGLLIHYSTDYVFDGSKDDVYLEDDDTCPVNAYGQSKLAGELAIEESGCDYLILRTSWVYAARGHNFLKTILRLATERDELSIVGDQFGAPTWARLIAETTAHVLRQTQSERRQGLFKSGIYNLTSTDATSWHGFAEAIVDLARQQGKLADKNPHIKPIPATAYPVPAKRPANSRLSVQKLEQHFDLKLPHWRESLALCLDELV